MGDKPEVTVENYICINDPIIYDSSGWVYPPSAVAQAPDFKPFLYLCMYSKEKQMWFDHTLHFETKKDLETFAEHVNKCVENYPTK